MRNSRAIARVVPLLGTWCCYGVNHTTYTIRTPLGQGSLAMSQALADAVTIADPVAVSSGLHRTESGPTHVHWIAGRGAHRLDLNIAASPDKVVVMLEDGRPAGWPISEYLSVRRELKRRLASHFGESNVVVES